jgi:2-C-methyl-D-erythritol 4-phosphate cytidylyltransferase
VAIALIVAAGEGQRLGAGRPKALVELGGRAMLDWSVDALRRVGAVRQIVLALPGGVPAPPGTTGVEGGAVRSDSVRQALRAAGPGDPVLVHDAARPLLTPGLAEAAIAALAADEVAQAAIVAAPVTDTVKRVEEGIVRETLDRSELWAVQTPQVFRRAALERALDVDEQTLAMATDDAWLVERTGGRVLVVEGPRENLKVTTRLDLALAELLLADARAQHPTDVPGGELPGRLG